MKALTNNSVHSFIRVGLGGGRAICQLGSKENQKGKSGGLEAGRRA